MESLSDIVAQMRGRGEDGRVDRHLWNEYADRIEAAAKRVVVSKTETVTVGNAAAMREALLAISETYREHPYDHDDDAIANIVDAALSAPPRQCDVGTAEDQAKRFEEFCNSHTCTTMDCKVRKSWSHFFQDCRLERVSCGLIFAHTPYAAEEGGAGE